MSIRSRMKTLIGETGQSWQPKDDSGRYAHRVACDACGKPVNMDGDWMTDDEVVGGGDGPGFYLCVRPPCLKKRDKLDLDGRKKLYHAQRTKNDTAAAARAPKHAKKAAKAKAGNLPPAPPTTDAAKWAVGAEVQSGNGMQGVVTGHDGAWVIVSWEGRDPKKIQPWALFVRQK